MSQEVHKPHHRHKHQQHYNPVEELTCKPLDNLSEIEDFICDPPPWRTLCKPLTTHSKLKIRNIENDSGHSREVLTEIAENYCHFDPDADPPTRYDVTKLELPKTLVCHDMANGYHDDSLIIGSVNYDSYTFYNWAGIDIFCYFSHHLITIPPVGWINVGHAHGVKVLGTIITEWNGSTFWDQVLETPAKSQEFAKSVVIIAKTLKFDGWLLNIENKVNDPKKLLEFVRYLHHTLHAELDDPLLIWYDSVTINGTLNWQNGLTAKNRPFFDICDGFFTNYSWTVEDIRKSVEQAGPRVTDVFVGIDVWGRNFYGGGQFNVQEAIKVVHQFGCSLAIFAPAWTHEAMHEPQEEILGKRRKKTDFDTFLLRDRALWDSIWPFLNTNLPCQMPFQTSFCRGQGEKRWMFGEVLSPGPWYNLRHQQYQPNAAHGSHGYVLHPVDNLLRISWIDGQKGGIIKYRKSSQKTDDKESSTDEESSDGDESPDLDTYDYKTPEIPKVEEIRKVENTLKIEETPKVEETCKENKTVANKEVQTQNDKIAGELQKADETHGGQKVLDRSEDNLQLQSTVKDNMHTLKTMQQNREDASADEPGTEAPAASERAIEPAGEPTSSPPTPPPQKPSIKIRRSFSERVKKYVKHFFHKNGHKSSNEQIMPARVSLVRAEAQAGTSSEVSEPKPKPKPREAVALPGGQTGRDPEGRQVSVSINLKSKQSKTRWALSHVGLEAECLQLWLEDAFCGGACLHISPADPVDTRHRTTRLFHCEFNCVDTLIVCIVTKQLAHFHEQHLNVRLKMVNRHGEDLVVVLLARPTELASRLHEASQGVAFSRPLDAEKQDAFRELRDYLVLHEPGFYVPLENLNGWTVRYHVVQVPGARVISISCKTERAQGGVLLGHFGITHRNLAPTGMGIERGVIINRAETISTTGI